MTFGIGRDFAGALAPQIDGKLRPYLRQALCSVVAVGSGANTGQVRVKLPGEDVLTADLPWAPVYGAVPAVSDVVRTFWDHASRFVVTTSTGGGGGVTSFETRTGAVVSAAGDYTATEITNTPAGNIAGTTVQAAINELDTEKAIAADLTAHLNDTVDAHDASAISYAGGTGMSATEVESAIDELATEKSNTGHTHAAADTTSGVFNIARLATGTPDGTKFVRDDGTLAVPGGGGYDPVASPDIFDDFVSGLDTAGNIGNLGWSFAIGTVTMLAGEAGHPGIIRRSSGATINNHATLNPRTSGVTGVFLPAEMFDMTWVIRIGQVTSANQTIRLGLIGDPGGNPGTDGIYVEHLGGGAGTWLGTTRAASTQSQTASLGTLDANWVKFRIRRVDASTIGFTLNAGTELTLTANIPTVELMPFIHLRTLTAAARTYDVDLFRLKITGLTR